MKGRNRKSCDKKGIEISKNNGLKCHNWVMRLKDARMQYKKLQKKTSNLDGEKQAKLQKKTSNLDGEKQAQKELEIELAICYRNLSALEKENNNLKKYLQNADLAHESAET